VIHGIGIDIIKINRMKEIVEKWGQKFLQRVFTENEISYCYGQRTPYLSLAVRFAAKEALIKALGYSVPMSFTDIEVVRTDTGQPVLKVSGKLRSSFEQHSITKTHLSLSHENDYGIAFVLLEK